MHRFWGDLVADLARRAAGGSDIARVRATILEQLERQIPNAGASFHTFGPDASADPTTVTRGNGRMVLERVTSVWAAQLAELEGNALGSIAELGCARIDEVHFGNGTARDTRTWKEVFEAVDVSDTLNAFVRVPGAAPRMLVLIRTGGERFTDHERDLLANLLPFLTLAEQRAESPVGRLPLTPAQKKIVELLRQGMTNDEIAHQLSLSTLTVRNQLSQVYERCGVSGRVELVALLERPPIESA